MNKILKSIDIKVDSSDVNVVVKKENGYSTVTINYSVDENNPDSPNQIHILDPREIINNEEQALSKILMGKNPAPTIDFKAISSKFKNK